MWKSSSSGSKRSLGSVDRIVYQDEVKELRTNPLSTKSKATRKKLREVALNEPELLKEVMAEVRKRHCRTHLCVSEVIHSVMESVVLKELDRRNLIQARPDRSASLRHTTHSPPRSTVSVEKRFSYPAMPHRGSNASVQSQPDDVLSQLKNAMSHSGFLARVAKKGSEVFFSGSEATENDRRQQISCLNIQTSEGRRHFLEPTSLSSATVVKEELNHGMSLKENSHSSDQSTLGKFSRTAVMSLLEKAACVLEKNYPMQDYEDLSYSGSGRPKTLLDRIDEAALSGSHLPPAMSTLEAFLTAHENVTSHQHRPHAAELESHVTEMVRNAQEDLDEDVSLLVDFPHPKADSNDNESLISGYLGFSQVSRGHENDWDSISRNARRNSPGASSA